VAAEKGGRRKAEFFNEPERFDHERRSPQLSRSSKRRCSREAMNKRIPPATRESSAEMRHFACDARHYKGDGEIAVAAIVPLSGRARASVGASARRKRAPS
jgi:hypothetical protein